MPVMFTLFRAVHADEKASEPTPKNHLPSAEPKHSDKESDPEVLYNVPRSLMNDLPGYMMHKLLWTVEKYARKHVKTEAGEKPDLILVDFVDSVRTAKSK